MAREVERCRVMGESARGGLRVRVRVTVTLSLSLSLGLKVRVRDRVMVHNGTA